MSPYDILFVQTSGQISLRGNFQVWTGHSWQVVQRMMSKILNSCAFGRRIEDKLLLEQVLKKKEKENWIVVKPYLL